MTQTPKEKAKELFDKFSDIENMGRYSDKYGFSSWSTKVLKLQCKQCALLVVDEILKNGGNYQGMCFEDNEMYIDTQYWESVRTEIEKL